MVNDDKEHIYKSIKLNDDNNNSKSAINFIRPSSKFATIPSNDRIHLYKAICADCHHEVQVNFEPIKDKPFYCDYCYVNHKVQHHKEK